MVVVGSFHEFPVGEGGAGADERDQVWAVHGAPAVLGGLDELEQRVGHGFRNFDNYRLRLLLHCETDWDTIRATPIRGRRPRSVA